LHGAEMRRYDVKRSGIVKTMLTAFAAVAIVAGLSSSQPTSGLILADNLFGTQLFNQ
jgi:hypothetical protein